MPTHAERQIVPYRPDQLFDLVADVGKYPQFLPWCVAARVRSRTERELVADLTIGFGPFRETFTSRVTLDRPQRVKVRYETGPFRYLNNQWEFSPIRRAARWTSSWISNSAAASCRPRSASCSTRRSAAWSAPSASARARSTARPSRPCSARASAELIAASGAHARQLEQHVGLEFLFIQPVLRSPQMLTMPTSSARSMTGM